MSLFKTKGLELDKLLSDVPNKNTALTNLLTTFNTGVKFTAEDIAPISGISEITFDQARAFGRLDGILKRDTARDGNPVIKPLQTLQNRFDLADAFIGNGSYRAGNGLTARYYGFEDLPASLQSELDSSPFDITNVFNTDESPSNTSVETLNSTTAKFTEVTWHRGIFNFGNDSFVPEITDASGAAVASYSGFVRFTNNYNAIDLRRDSTNVYLRVIVRDALTNERIIDGSFDPNTSGDNRVEFSSKKEGINIENYRPYKINIIAIITKDLAQSTPAQKQFSIGFRDTFNTDQNTQLAYKTNFYSDDHTPHTNLGVVKTFEDKLLPVYGSFYNMNEDYLPTINTQYEVGDPTNSTNYKDLITTSSLEIFYKPKKNISEVRTFTSVVTNVPQGATFINCNTTNVTNAKVGNYVHGVTSVSGNPVYVVESRSKRLFLSEPINALASGTIAAIDHRGLKQVATLVEEEAESPHRYILTKNFANGPDAEDGDVIIFDVPNTEAKFGSSSTTWVQVKDTSPLDFKFIGNQSRTLNDISLAINGADPSSPHSITVFIYAKSGIENLALDNLCNLPSNKIAKAITTREFASGVTVIDVEADSLIEYGGNLLNPSDIIGKFIAFDPSSSVIPQGTTVLGATSHDSPSDKVRITLSSATTGKLIKGAGLILSGDENTALGKVVCFRPTDTSPPFVAIENGLRTAPEDNRAILELQTTAHDDSPSKSVELEFSQLKIIGDTPTITREIVYADNNNRQALYDTKLRYRVGSEQVDRGTGAVTETVVTYEIPLSTV